MPIEEKKHMKFLQLCDKTPEHIQLPNEKMPQILKTLIYKMPFLYEDEKWLSLD